MSERLNKCDRLLENPTFEHLFDLLCEKRDDEALVWLENGKETKRTFGELRDLSLSCAARVQSLGAGEEGGWVGVSVDTCPDWPALFWGLMAAGRNVLLLDASMDDEKTAHLLAQPRATAIVCRKDRNVGVKVIRPEDLLVPSRPIENAHWADKVAFCTSGTTSTSRVFAYDAKAICANIAGIARRQTAVNPVTRESRGPMRTLCFLPLHHIFGFMTNLMWTNFIGYPQVFLKDRSPETILTTVKETRVSFIITVPLLINHIADGVEKKLAQQSGLKKCAFAAMKWLSLTAQRINPMMGLSLAKKLFHSVNANIFGDSLDLIVVGGSHMPREHLTTVNALGYCAIAGYGMTEIGVPSANAGIALEGRLDGACGAAFETSEYRIRPDGSDPGHGEVLVKTCTMHMGQYVDGQLIPPQLDKDGFYATGDIGRLPADGNLRIEGRIKDVIVDETGENIYPDELEDVFTAMPGAEQFCVLGTQLSGDYETPTLVINVGSKYHDEAFLSELSAEIQRRNKKLPAARRVKKVLVTPERMPVVNSVKIKRIDLRASLQGHTVPYRELTGQGVGAEVAAANAPDAVLRDNPEIHDKVLALFAETLGRDPKDIPDRAHIMDDLGGNSLQVISLSLKVEEAFSVTIPEEQYASCATVAGLTDLICEMKGL